jgi:nitrate reductase NapE component
VWCGFFCQGSLVNCSSNVILFATSEGSPSRFNLTTYLVLVNFISPILRFKGQVGGFGSKLRTDLFG